MCDTSLLMSLTDVITVYQGLFKKIISKILKILLTNHSILCIMSIYNIAKI